MIVNPILYQQGTKLPELTNPGAAADLLAGKQLVDQYGNPLTGTMPQRSAADLTASGAAVTVPAGYYPSQMSKSVATATHPKPTLSRSGGTVTAQHVQSAGYTSGGTTTETLTIPTQAGKTVTPTTYTQTAVSSGRLTTGAVNVAGDANLVAGNIKSGVTIFGVSGTMQAQEAVTFSLTNNSYNAQVDVTYWDSNRTVKTIALAARSNATITTFVGAPLVVKKRAGYIPNASYSGVTSFFDDAVEYTSMYVTYSLNVYIFVSTNYGYYLTWSD